MSLPLLLAQAASTPPVYITQELGFSFPIVAVLLTLAVGVGEARWRMSRLEKDVEKEAAKVSTDLKALEEKHSNTAREHTETKQQVAVLASTLGRIEKGQENLERMLREALTARSP